MSRDSSDGAAADSAPPATARIGLVVAAATCASVVVSHIFGRFSYSVLLPAIQDDLIGSFTGAGFLGASYFAGYMLGVIGVTAISARVEPLTLLQAGLALSAVALGAMAAAPNLLTLAAGVFTAGLAGAGIWVPAPTIATSRMTDQHRGLVMGALTASMGLGLLLVSQGTTLYRRVVDDEGAWRLIFGVEALIAVLVFAAAALVARRLRAHRLPTSSVTPTPAAAPAARAPIIDLSGLRRIPSWALLLVTYGVFALLAGSWVAFLGVAMEEDAGYTRTHVNNLFSAFAVAAVPGPLILGRLSDRIGRDITMVIACSMSAVASGLLTVGSEPWTAIAVVLFGVGSFSVPPLTAAAVRDHLEGRAFATAFGAMTIIYALVSMVSAQSAGIIADAVGGFDLVYWLLAAAAASCAGAAAARYRWCRSSGNT